MALNASTSAAAEADQARARPGARIRPRLRLISPAALAGLALLIAAALLVLYPQRELLERLAKARQDDPLTVQYLVNLNRVEPGDAETALLLAGARLAQGELTEVVRLAAPLESAADAATRRRAILLHAAALPVGKPRAALIAPRINEDWTRDELLQIAGMANAANDAALRSAAYARLAIAERDPEWFARTARETLGAGDYRLSAQLWFGARTRAPDRDSARAYYLEGLRTLQSGNLLAEALAAAEAELGDLAGDEEAILAVVKLALAAGRPDVAERWMKRLLWPGTARGAQPAAAARLLGWLIASAAAADVPPGMRPYDERVYTFAYEVFLASGNLADAYRVAQSAVAQRPDDLAWREKLARVAEWSRHPAVALEHWLFLAQRSNQEDAWQGVLRLAPGLGADEALFLAMRRQAERKDARPEDLKNFAALYERLGRPRDGIAWFAARYAATGQVLALELAAELADHAGERDRAIELNRQLIAKAGPSEDRLVRTATLLVLAGKFRAAHDLLNGYRATIRPEAADYWDLLGDLAWRLQEDESAIFAYRALSTRKEAESGEFDRLVTLLRERHPEEAAKVAEFGFARFRTPGLLLSALEIHWERKDLPAMKRVYAGLGGGDEKAFDAIPFYYSLRSQYRQAGGDLKGARADLERAIAIAPQNAELKVALAWLLIDAKDTAALKQSLEEIARSGADTPDLRALQAAGWMTLGEPRRALPFHARLARDKPDDYLGLMGYADALEQAGLAGESARVRRQAWVVVRKAASQDPARNDRQLRETVARLALTLAPADAQLAVVRDLLRRDLAPGLAPDEKNRAAAVKELVLSWALSGEQYSNAKAWLWLQYGRKLAAPGWAEAAVALGENDVEAAERLLADRSLPAGTRIEAARLAQKLALAQTLAFEEQERRPEDDSLHLQLADSLLAGASRVIGSATSSVRGVIRAQPRELQAQVWLAPRLRLALEWREAAQSSTDPAVIRSVPARDRETRVSLRQLLDSGWVEAGLGQREGLASQGSLRASLFTQWDRRFSTLFSAGRNERTLDSTALAVAGSKDELAARFAYTFSKSEYLAGGVRGARYQTQGGAHLGSGSAAEWELGHRVRIEYPDLTVRVTAANYRFSADGAPDAPTAQLNPAGGIPGAAFFIPQNSRIVGAGVGFGESARDTYSRALRPYGSFARTMSSLAGSGYNALIGAGGSLFGADRLSLYWNRARGGGTSGASILEYGLRYEYLFDR
ncbi:MAG: tetratricopeptide repeat protein [Proteobacteria bacterium]|nr:tetratricopeptide repeat protein [Pseudomonadota bacterium]